MTNTEKNPLISPSEHKNQALPFPDIKTEHFLPALEWAMEQGKSAVEAIKNQAQPDFENTIVALERANEDVELVASTFFNLLSAHSNDDMQKLAGEFSPKLSSFSNDISLDEKLFAQVKTVYEKLPSLELNNEQKQLLEESYSSFIRNGALLSDDDKEKLRKVDEKLAQLSPAFSNNVLKETNAFELLITDKEDLAGLPEGVVAAALSEAEAKEKKGWMFNLQAPSFIPFMKYSEKRELREKIWLAYSTRAVEGDQSNQGNILDTVKLRHQRAQLLGFKNHADFTLKKRMAETPEKVESFLQELQDASKKAATQEVAELQEFANKLSGPNPLMPWDFAFYSEKYKQEKFQFDEEKLRPYFQLENVISGAFLHAEKLYGLTFKEDSSYPKYHEDVKTYEVFDKNSGDFIGVFYTDFFPRDSKRGGAWMTAFYQQGLFKGKVIRPHISIVCNFTKPTKEKPSLLSLDEVRTLFHEFGHALHGLLSQCTYRSLGGTNVYWDFVELPSQILENWTLEKESLDLFAKHYETGEGISEEDINKIKSVSNFQAGYASLRQVNFAKLDMAWHNSDPTNISDVLAFEKENTKETQVLPTIEGTCFSCGFGHIFAGGYSAGYYSYKWAEVLDADAFELFKEKGIFNADVAKSFKENILSAGGTEHPMELYKKFRGREPDTKALLRRDGLI